MLPDTRTAGLAPEAREELVCRPILVKRSWMMRKRKRKSSAAKVVVSDCSCVQPSSEACVREALTKQNDVGEVHSGQVSDSSEVWSEMLATGHCRSSVQQR